MAQKPLSQEVCQQAVDAVREHGSVRAAAKALGVSLPTLDNRVRRAKDLYGLEVVSDESQSGERTTKEETKEALTLETLSPRIKTLEEALAHAEVDLAAWEVDKFTIASWEMGMKVETMVGKSKVTIGSAVTPLWKIHVTLKPRRGWSIAEFRDILKREAQRDASKCKPIRYSAPKGEQLLFVPCLFDPHFGKLGWRYEVGEDYDLEIAEQRYTAALQDLLAQVAHLKFSRSLYIVGNDFLHTDNRKGTTTAGTPQDVDGRWQKAFVIARRVACASINVLREVAPVDVMIVPGNHDLERCFYLGDSIEGRFEADKCVTVDNGPCRRKYYRHGRTLLGATHGCDEKHADLPGVMADEVPDLWAQTTWREWLTGHYHKKRELRFVKTDTHGATLVRTISSLAGSDDWHHSKAYRAPHAAEALVYSNERGYRSHCCTNVGVGGEWK